MGIESIFKGDRKRIFELFFEKTKWKFSEIEKRIAIRSNMIAYHLDGLKKDKVLIKTNDFWQLSKQYERLIPFFSYFSDMSMGCMSVVLVIATFKDKGSDKLLLVKRTKKPYKDYWSVFGRKITLNESICEAAVNCMTNETGIETKSLKFKKVCSIIHERLKEDDEFKHAFLFVLTLVEITAFSSKLLRNKNLSFYSFDELEKIKIIPSDLHMIKTFINKRTKIHEVIMKEKEDELVDFSSF